MYIEFRIYPRIINNIRRWVASFPVGSNLWAPSENEEASCETSFDFRQRHLFTPQEASRLLPDIKPRLKELIDKRKVADALKTELDRYILLGFGPSELAERAAQLDALRENMGWRVEEIEDMGVKVKDLANGLVDFPAERFGREVLLCWMYGEPEVSYWHELDEGYPGRRAVKMQLIQP